MTVPHMISGNGNITLIIDGRQFYVNASDSNYNAVLDAIRDDISEEDLLTLLNKAEAVDQYFTSYNSDDVVIQIVDGEVLYLGEPVHGSVVDRILAFMDNGLPVDPLVNFLEKLMRNPSYSARNELFDFLDHKQMPITEDGDFLAYKAVQHDYQSKSVGPVRDFRLGKTPEMPRSQVDDDRNHGCSFGLHAGTLSYAKSFGNFSRDEGGDRIIIVKINPEDVVSVPSDCQCQKLRACTMLSLKDYSGPMEAELYCDDGDSWYEDEEEDSNVSVALFEEGDVISFVYHDKQREGDVESINDNLVRVYVTYEDDEPIGHIKSFHLDEMEDVDVIA